MKRKVLIADDEEGILAFVQATLENDGTVEIFVARDGEEALKLARQVKPDVVVLDVMMPKMNGYEVCLELKRDPAMRETKVVMLTALDQEFDRVKALHDIGADAYVAKPFSPAELMMTMQEMLAGRPTGG